MLHTTLHGEYSTRTIGKDYERLVGYSGSFGLLLCEGEVLIQNYPGRFNEDSRRWNIQELAQEWHDVL